MVVLVFDTDAGNLAMLEENINVLKKHSAVSGVLCIPQVPNLEGELKRSCNIKQIRELTNSKTNKDFKRDLIMDSNFKQKLLKYQFDLWKFWNTDGIYNGKVIENDAGQIKLNKQD